MIIIYYLLFMFVDPKIMSTSKLLFRHMNTKRHENSNYWSKRNIVFAPTTKHNINSPLKGIYNTKTGEGVFWIVFNWFTEFYLGL